MTVNKFVLNFSVFVLLTCGGCSVAHVPRGTCLNPLSYW